MTFHKAYHLSRQVKFTLDNILKYFSYFFQKTDIDTGISWRQLHEISNHQYENMPI